MVQLLFRFHVQSLSVEGKYCGAHDQPMLLLVGTLELGGRFDIGHEARRTYRTR